MIRIVLLLAFVIASPVLAQTMYKWVDEKGVTHYSENPPPQGTKSQKVEPKYTPAAPAATRPENWKDREAEARKSRIEKAQAEEKAQGKAENAAAQRRNRCLRAQRSLHQLDAGVPLYDVNEKGERVYLEDNKREEERREAQEWVKRYCD